jgi:Meiosis-specific coiled-coil domain-containing protein MEIOC
LQVVTLVMRVEQIRDGDAVPVAIHLAMAQWFNGIGKLQMCRQDEIFNAANRHYSRSPQYQKERGL